MVNLLHLCETMTTKWCDESEIRVPIDQFRKFAKKNNFTIETKVKGSETKYKLTRRRIPVHFISGNEQTSFSFMDIADIHIGHSQFNENSLREKLQYAMDNGIQDVFIAGDLFEGICQDSDECAYINQLEVAFDIFKDYPLNYYAINGNHDYSFEQRGFPNPVRTLSTALLEEEINFKYFDTYLIDFVICGVIKRVMHVERQDFSKKSIFATLKLKQFEGAGMLVNTYKGVEYPVRFFQVGHIHVNVQMYYSKKKVFISQSGCFLSDNDNEDNANIISGRVIDQKVFMN